LDIIHQILYVYFHMLDFYCEVKKVNLSFIILRPWNPT
jgi:hypothetical protein